MEIAWMKAVAMTAALTAGLATPTLVRADPDLVINIADTFIRPGGCGLNEPIASGRIAIKNQGTTTANLGVTERFTRSMLVIYVPENVDMIDKRTEREKLDPFDQEGVEFELASGIVKKGRHFGRPPSALVDYKPATGNPEQDRARTLAIQTALDRLGYEPGTIDGILGNNSRRAIRSFQASLGAAQTGTLTDNQTKALLEKAGVQVGGGSGAIGPTKVTIYAVVDPYNLIAEQNEANNIFSFEVEIDCSN
ncbi:MAG: peptidoglycan-binding protein [Hyphomicrobiaceae bacterium]|nr:peptidoglycan-binding protein [Hyphomicrobiaceae bacterium]